MAAKKSFPLRINPEVLAATQRWADDELRSVNAQIEYILREALVKSGRVKLVQQVTTIVEDTDQSKDK
ncbi:Arc family DNA-binding protein [Thalassotalea atypica]|uniref:Arc family DNA-binding protein n=1 Tax=Thalassotalea atypica TaxID=2054316 RepID=UPI002573C85F|nr:Arc family DNA-binding protein [Thalassotalea atypica]